MSTNLSLLAKQVLYAEGRSIPKVRFAKIIYFAYKMLVKNSEALATDIAFVRMPLGPVADGYMTLDNDSEISVETDSIGLHYNRQRYFLNSKTNYFNNTVHHVIKRLQNVSTSQLVAISHMDQSWKSNINGHRFYIQSQDLANEIPLGSSRNRVSQTVDDQLIQSQLLDGMIDDAVMDSSALEYPSHYQ